MYPWKVIVYLYIPAEMFYQEFERACTKRRLYWSLSAPTIERMESLLTSGIVTNKVRGISTGNTRNSFNKKLAIFIATR